MGLNQTNGSRSDPPSFRSPIKPVKRVDWCFEIPARRARFQAQQRYVWHLEGPRQNWRIHKVDILSVSRSLIYNSAHSFPDTTRGVLNEGGLFGERVGWHLPGFDTSSWVERDFSAGLPNGAAGIGFFVTTFPLNIPAGFDVMLSFTFDESTQPYRALLFINGWMMGKRVANLGYAIFHER
jgi:Beta-galactosidase jelly roll domain